MCCSLRICIDPNDEIKAGLLAQADSGEGLLTPGQWQHLGLTYTQHPEGKKNIHGRVVVWVCGIRWGVDVMARIRILQFVFKSDQLVNINLNLNLFSS